jgi:hypothetical protein
VHMCICFCCLLTVDSSTDVHLLFLAFCPLTLALSHAAVRATALCKHAFVYGSFGSFGYLPISLARIVRPRLRKRAPVCERKSGLESLMQLLAQGDPDDEDEERAVEDDEQLVAAVQAELTGWSV